jgi:hypothetical protein
MTIAEETTMTADSFERDLQAARAANRIAVSMVRRRAHHLETTADPADAAVAAELAELAAAEARLDLAGSRGGYLGSRRGLGSHPAPIQATT